MGLRLDSKVAVITGASSGIGRSIARAFASQGTKLVVCADIQPSSQEMAGKTQEAVDVEDDSWPTHELICKIHGEGRAVFVKCDVSLGIEDGGIPLNEGMPGGEDGLEKVRGVHVAVEEAVKIGGKLDM